MLEQRKLSYFSPKIMSLNRNHDVAFFFQTVEKLFHAAHLHNKHLMSTPRVRYQTPLGLSPHTRQTYDISVISPENSMKNVTISEPESMSLSGKLFWRPKCRKRIDDLQSFGLIISDVHFWIEERVIFRRYSVKMVQDAEVEPVRPSSTFCSAVAFSNLSMTNCGFYLTNRTTTWPQQLPKRSTGALTASFKQIIVGPCRLFVEPNFCPNVP